MVETILLVEDDASLRRLAERLVSKLGYAPLVADGPARAVQIAATHTGHIDLLITDIFMPEIGGPELARQLLVTRPDMKVLYVSGSPDPAENGMLPPGAHFLQKPYMSETFAKKIRELLSDAEHGNKGATEQGNS